MLNNKTILNFEAFNGGDPPGIVKTFHTKDIDVVFFEYGTGGNHSGAEINPAIGFFSNKRYQVVAGGGVDIYGVKSFNVKENSDGMNISWRTSASTIYILNCTKNSINETKTHNNKTMTQKDYDDIYYVYKEMCVYAENNKESINQYEMVPAGYYSGFYFYYQDIIEKGIFKLLCYEMATGKQKQFLSKKEFISKIRP